MPTRPRVLACSILVVALSVFAVNAGAQDKKAAAKVDKAVLAEQAATVKMMDEVIAGHANPSDFSFTFASHLMKSRDGKAFIPFVLTFDKAKALPASACYYLRVVSKAGTGDVAKKMAEHKAALDKAATQARLDPENSEAQDAEAKLRASGPKVEWAFEDLRMQQSVAPATAGGAPRFAGAMALSAGEYDIYMLFKEPNPKDKKAQPKAGVLKTTLSVPNLFNDELTASTVFVTNVTEQLKAMPTQEDLNKYPYIFGNIKVTPLLEATPKFAKKDELSIFFYIYNTGLDAAGKPNLTVDYNFYRKDAGAEKFFNRTNPQAMNATTLPPQFDVKAGHQLMGGQSIPLASFPEGEYRLEIKITDKVTGKTKVENTTFAIVAAAS